MFLSCITRLCVCVWLCSSSCMRSSVRACGGRLVYLHSDKSVSAVVCCALLLVPSAVSRRRRNETELQQQQRDTPARVCGVQSLCVCGRVCVVMVVVRTRTVIANRLIQKVIAQRSLLAPHTYIWRVAVEDAVETFTLTNHQGTLPVEICTELCACFVGVRTFSNNSTAQTHSLLR